MHFAGSGIPDFNRKSVRGNKKRGWHDMINLKEKPFYLSDRQIDWVNQTLENMTEEEKCGQVFCEVIWGEETKDVDRIFKYVKPGAVMFRDLHAEAVHRLSN